VREREREKEKERERERERALIYNVEFEKRSLDFSAKTFGHLISTKKSSDSLSLRKFRHSI